jgi:hypothetical protein
MTKGRPITRRTMLRGLGTAIALPWLEAMGPARAAAGPPGKPPLRMVFVYHPLGAETTAWKGARGEGNDLQLSPTLQPLAPVKQHLLVLDGLNGRPHPASGHNRSACLWLSSAPPGKADTWGAETDVTLDQVVAPKLSAGARQQSLELSCTTVGNLMHAMNVSWRGPGAPMGAETRPADVFARMFGDPKADRRRKSILDTVADDARQLRSRLGQGDHRRLDEYLESVRSLERQIALDAGGAAGRPAPPLARPKEPRSLREHVRLMLDLLVVALQTDFTRVLTCALGDESEASRGTTYERTLADFGIDRAAFAGRVASRYLDWGHHKCTHDPRPTLPLIQAIDRWYVEQCGYLLHKLQSVREGEGTLLDHSIVVYGCTNSSGTNHGWPGHDIKDVGCVLAGRGGGLLPRTGRQVRYPKGTSLGNLWLTLAQLCGIRRKDFGRSTGTLSGLG